MKTYEVELKRVSFVTITVEAGSTEEAEFIAWQELDNHNDKYADWEIESIEEITK
jgi:hypothetical protein